MSEPSFALNPWPQERAVAASAAVRASPLSPSQKRKQREQRQISARNVARQLWALEAFFEPAPPDPKLAEDGFARPDRCNIVPGGVSHRLLWVAEAAAVCANGGCNGTVWELVFDGITKRYRLRPNRDSVARYLAIEMFKERSVDDECYDAVHERDLVAPVVATGDLVPDHDQLHEPAPDPGAYVRDAADVAGGVAHP